MTNLTFPDVSTLFCSLAFVLLISIIYYKKTKINTLENIIFNIIVFTVGLLICLTSFRLLVSYISPNITLYKFMYKIQTIVEVVWAVFTVSYIIFSSSVNNQGYVAFKDNTKKSYFIKILILIVSVGVISAFVILGTDVILVNNAEETNFTLETYLRLYQKISLTSIMSWLFSIIYYLILRLKYEKTGNEAPKNSFIPRLIILILFNIVVALFMSLIKLEVNITDNIDSYGYGLLLRHMLIYVGGILINFQLLTRAEYINPSKFIPVILFIPFYVLACILELYVPNFLPICVVFALETVYLYFTIENPDTKLIQELKASRADAESANSQKTRFLSVMSHEIRTPLNAIVGFGQALKEANISKEAEEEVDDIIMSSNNLIDIVNGILDISKIETDQLEIVEKEYDSKRMFREIVALAKARLASKPIDLRINIDSTIPPVLYGDYLRVKQVIINILTNSIKYTKEGYINFTVNTLASNDKIILDISVKDTGIGIKQEDLNKLFTKFQRLDLEKNSSTEGTGLGLAITKRLVELMNGTITVDSVYGEGTTFNIKISQGIVQKTSDDIQDELKQVNEVAKVNKTSKILVVDDNAINLKVFSRLLQDYNLTPDTLNSGEQCLDAIKSGKKYDLIFLDDMMPNLTGTETLKILKEIPDFNTPVIAFTANAISGMREQYLNNGFNEYLPKPVKKELLNNILDLFLNGRTSVELNNYNAKNTQMLDGTKKASELRFPPPQDAVDKDIAFKEINMHNKLHTLDFLVQNEVDVNHGVEILGDLDTYDMLFDEFNDSIKERYNNIILLKDEKKWDRFIIEVHDLKKDAKYLGFTKLADLSLEHEMYARDGEYNNIYKEFDNLKMEIERIIIVSKKYTGK